MPRVLKKQSGVYTFLNSTKVLENGSDQDIAAARKEYWKGYKARWRKQQRTVSKEFMVICTPEEAKDILDAARKHKCSRSNFIKKSCLAYIHKTYIVPDLLAVNTIRQQLAMNLNFLQKLFEENKVPYQAGTALMQQMTVLEQTVLAQLHSPKTLEQWITETVRTAPEYKEILTEILNRL